MMFKTPELCRKQLNVWMARRDHILNGSPNSSNFRPNIWDGDRIKQLDYFFDPNRLFVLPCWCTECKGIIPSASIVSAQQNSQLPDGMVYVHCVECDHINHVQPVASAGNPRNILLKLHYDGWLPAGIGQKSLRASGSIEVLSACLDEVETAKASNINGIPPFKYSIYAHSNEFHM